jgi:hypothetical protein
MIMKNRYLLLLLVLNIALSGYAQKFPATWIELGVSKQIVKNLKVELSPELRLLDSLKMDSYIIEGGLSYKLHKYLTLASYYRYDNVYKYKKKSGAYKNEEHLNMLAFDAKSGFDFDRFGIQFRLRYTQGLYANNNASEFRFRTKVDYDIKNCKLVPYFSLEIFHDYLVLATERDLISGQFKGIDKIRYLFGTSYTINKNNEVAIYYRFQDNRIKNTMNNVIGIGYNFDF